MGTKKDQNKKLNPLLWVPIIIIPLLVLGAATVFILNMAGISVTDWAHKHNVPVLSTVLKTDEEKDLQLKFAQSESKIAKQKETISDLQLDIDGLEATINDLEQEIVKLTNTQEQEEFTIDGQVESEITTVKKIAASFKKMKGKQAAQIVENLDETTAVLILQELSNDVRGKVLESMDPNKAARLTKLFIEAE